jgi:hypothetical protein
VNKALVVGIDFYEAIPALYGCVNDAHNVRPLLERNSDGSINFDVRFLAATSAATRVRRATLRDSIRELFKDENEIALFYFAGHGHIDVAGGYLCASDSQSGDDGVALSDILVFANKSPSRNKIVILDSCHGGIAGANPLNLGVSELSEGMTILTASTAEQYASEEDGTGVFTNLLVDALGGAAGNLVGDITPGSVYAHIDQSLGQWEQRPVFKTNVKSFVSLRKVQAPIALADLQRLVEFFPKPGITFDLDPSFEPERNGGEPPGTPPPSAENTQKFAVLQRLNRVNLLVPLDAPHMWHAAMNYKGCKLTVLGEHYRRLVEKKRI